MPTSRKRGSVSPPHRIGLVALVFAISAGAAIAGSSRSAREPERIFVTAVSGSVSVTMAGAATPVQLDSTVGLPARIVTGDDGMLSLTQAGTNITIAADSDVEIPAEASDGQLIARLVQRRGNVFYDVAHREAGTLRVETPFLVAVIKGTQFNVAVQEDGSTISLFQGRLEIKTPDGSDSVFINAGQIARRASADRSINVIGMNDVRLQTPRSVDAVARAAAKDDPIQPRVFATPAATGDLPAAASQARLESASAAGDFRTGLDLGTGVSVGGILRAGVGPAVSANASAGLGIGGPPASVGADVNVGRGSSVVSPGVGAGLGGAGGVPASVGVNLNVGTGSADVSLGASAGVGTGGGQASVGANLGVGAGSSSVSLGASAGAGAGGAPASVGANLNVGAGSSGASLGAGVSLGSPSVGAGVTVDLGLGNNGLVVGAGGKGDDDSLGLHLGTGGSIGANLGLHLGNGSGNLGSPGKSRSHP